MSIAVLVATYGDREWRRLASRKAVPSAFNAGFENVVQVHLDHQEASLAEARNQAARLAEATWLVFLDADDQLGDDYAVQIGVHRSFTDEMAHPRPRLLAPKMRRLDWDGVTVGGANWPNQHEPMTNLNHCCIGTAVPRWLFMAAGGFREYPVYEDWELWLRCIRLGAEIEYTDAVYLADLSHGRNTARDVNRKAIYEQIKREHQEALSSAA